MSGPETFESFATSWSGPRFSAKAGSSTRTSHPATGARSSRNDTTDLKHSNAPRLPRSCRNAAETKRKPRGGLDCRARSSTGGSASTDSSKLPSRNRQRCRVVWRGRHVPIESNEADPARAVGIFSRPRSNGDGEVRYCVDPSSSGFAGVLAADRRKNRGRDAVSDRANVVSPTGLART